MLACCAAAAFLVGQIVWFFKRARAWLVRGTDPRLVVEVDAAAVWRPGSAAPDDESAQAIRPAWRKPTVVSIIVSDVLLVFVAVTILTIEPARAMDGTHWLAPVHDWWCRAFG